jgi:hypothetical protein
MQDRFNDAGWGCAYRSLQTICSWLYFQRYTTIPVPSHVEIQEILVAQEEKPDYFVGSRDWIGSTELNVVLSTRYGIDCKIMFISSGGEIANKARDIAKHFQTQGTPIMMGMLFLSCCVWTRNQSVWVT